ncbi:MAG: NifU family protein [Candidatus Latescibacter sp.]|nr:NifU family protein [Candidatus Latescibacter sp.]
MLPLEARVEKALELVRPYLRADGGDVEFVGLSDDNVVTVKLTGACHGCPSSQMTLQMGVERILKEKVPEVARVEAL